MGKFPFLSLQRFPQMSKILVWYLCSRTFFFTISCEVVIISLLLLSFSDLTLFLSTHMWPFHHSHILEYYFIITSAVMPDQAAKKSDLIALVHVAGTGFNMDWIWKSIVSFCFPTLHSLLGWLACLVYCWYFCSWSNLKHNIPLMVDLLPFIINL